MPFQDESASHTFKIAIVGGGRRCLSFLQLMELKKLNRLHVDIAGIADVHTRAVGFEYARKKGIFTTARYRDLFDIPGLELILNLTGNIEFSHELNKATPEDLPVLNHIASRLFQEIVQDVFTSTQQIARQKEALSLNHSFIQALAEVTVVGAMVIDTHYKVVWINESALKKIGLRKDEVLGRYCFQISHNAITPCDSPESPCPMKETLKTGQSAHAIHEHIHHDKERYCDVSTFPIFNDKGQIVQVLEVVRDITAEMNDRLDHKTRAIKNDLARLVHEDKIISLGKMVASVAHEINNPIGSIINFNKLILKIIEQGPPTHRELEDFKRYLHLTVREAQRCGKIVSNLLSFSRQQQMETKKIDLTEMFQRIVALTQHKMMLSNIKLILDFEPIPLEVLGDYTQIQQCFTNFVFNAMEAMPRGGELTIKAGINEMPPGVWVTVTDTGVGIPNENMDKIFEPFFSTKTEVSGVGLGLAMVYGIIKAHNGHISVESELNKGTTFRIILPAHTNASDAGGKKDK
ncbi:PAS domain S-box-containing protein [Desulfocicer vacuolatum DSM 3385]|uniref:histidine kinase n=1 Tax=Desulfocicer vacuolatum DSM 3385 TaxID=1121400 RepID=A0A1W2CK55_9BACT|nr:ATP-binding protein [Desulfocicer vacuolatum]SMC85570.1 PAS domain S-box-containing protein [Desulfocicer vacuolatum DSM 3385]